MLITSASEVAAPVPEGSIGSMTREHRQLALALLFSLLFHALLLSLTFGRGGLWLPQLDLRSGDRRSEVTELRVVLVPAIAQPARSAIDSVDPSPSASIKSPVDGHQAPTVSPALHRAGRAATSAMSVFMIAPSASGPERSVATSQDAGDGAQAFERREGSHAEEARSVDERIGVEREEATAAKLDAKRAELARQEAARIDAARRESERHEAARQAAERLEAQRAEAARLEMARVEAARLASEREETDRNSVAQQNAQRVEAARQEAARIEAARLETERQELARQAAAQLDAQRDEAARQEAARVAVARLEAERQEAARQAAAQLEAQRAESVRQEAARIEAARLDAERQETARKAAAQLEAQRAEAARQDATRAEAARLEAERQAAAREPPTQSTAQPSEPASETPRVAIARPEADHLQVAAPAVAPREPPRGEADEREARREAALRAIGRELDQEAGRREGTSPSTFLPSALPLSLSTARRVRVWGRTHPNEAVIQYAEAWARKIQLNTAFEAVREVAKRPHTPPMVTVAIRSGGSVESVTFVVSSGVAAIDDAVRQIVESQKPYPAFPAALAREFDVIEIRRTWAFDGAFRLY